MRPARRAALLGATALTMALLAACSSSPDAPAEEGSTAAATGTAGDGAKAAPASGAGVDDLDPADVVAEQTYTVPGSEDKVTVGVHSLVVKGDVMVLNLFFTPEFADHPKDEPISVFDMVGAAWDPSLVDRENLKEYTILSENVTTDWAADQVYTEATNGEPVLWWGGYAAPQDDIDTVDVRVLDELPEFTDVPITR